MQRHVTLKRRDTTVTPAGRHSATAIHPSAARRSDSRKKSLFVDLERKGTHVAHARDCTPELGANPSDFIVEEIVSDAQARFARFRWVTL